MKGLYSPSPCAQPQDITGEMTMKLIRKMWTICYRCAGGGGCRDCGVQS